jgi:cyclohexadienyl dehydratase
MNLRILSFLSRVSGALSLSAAAVSSAVLAFTVALAPAAALAQASAPGGAPASPAPAAPAVSAGSRLAKIKASGVLRVGTTGDYVPYTYLDPGTQGYSGMDIDVAQAFAKSLGVKVVFVPTTWPTMTSDLLADKFDLAMGGVSASPERAANGDLSHPYLTDGKVALVRAGDKAKFMTLAQIDQPGVRIAVNPGGTNQKFVNANIKVATVTVVEKNLSIPDLVATGAADVMITDGVEAALAAKRDPRLVVADPANPFTKLQKDYFLHKDDPAFEAALDAWIDRALSDGTYAKLRAKWIG